MLKKRWIAIWMVLIMLFSCFPVQVFAAGASIKSERAVDISETNATFKAVLNNPTGIQPSEVGIYFGETQGSMRPAAKDTYVYNQASLDFWYNANADMGITLKPATTYWYRFYAIINGQTVWGSFKSMQTAGQVVQQAQPQPQAKPQASFGNEKVNDKTETNGTFYGVLYNPTGIQPSEVGCYIGKSTDSMMLLGRDTYVYNRSSLEVWYNANAEGVRLEPGTKYYYQFYAVIGGQKVMGDRKSVTTNGAAAGVHIHDWKTVVEKAHPHKSVRSCACGVSEVVNSSNYVTSCTTCNPPAAVKKAVFQNGTYEISNNASGKFLNAYGSGSGWKVVTIAGDGSAEQRFTLNGSNGNYAIQTQGYGGRGLYLNGTSLLTGQTGQFCFVNRGNGYTISPANDPSKVLTQTNTAMYGGDHVVTLQNYTGAANQLWTLSHKTAPQQAAASFEQRTYAPTYGQGYFGAPYNNFPFNNGNCTWYVYGRAYEILGKAPVFNGNAADFWNYRDSYYGHSTNPTAAKPGAVMVWGGGDGGYGHVAVVEAVNGNTITISESSYGGVWYTGSYWGRTNLNVNNLNIYGLTFKGYIYLMPGSSAAVQTQTPVTQKPVVQKPTETVSAQKKPYFSDIKVTNQTSTGAQLNAVLNNPTGIKPKEVGCYISESAAALKLGAKDTVVNNQGSLPIWYDVNKDMGKTLKPGTTYYYQFYAVVNNQNIESDVKTFMTRSITATEKPIFRDYILQDLTYDNANVNIVFYNPTGVAPSEVGCMLSGVNLDFRTVGKNTSCSNKTDLDISYNFKNECKKTLTPNTLYHCKFYAVVNGTKYVSGIYSFTTKAAPVAETKPAITVKETKTNWDVFLTESIPGALEVIYKVSPLSDIETCRKAIVEEDYVSLMENITEGFLDDTMEMIGGTPAAKYSKVATIVKCAPYYIDFADAVGKLAFSEVDIHKRIYEGTEKYYQGVAKEATTALLLGQKHRNTSVPIPKDDIEKAQHDVDQEAKTRIDCCDMMRNRWYMTYHLTIVDGVAAAGLKKYYDDMQKNVETVRDATDIMEIYMEGRYGK